MHRQSHFSFEHMDFTAGGMQAPEEALYSKDILFNLGCYVLAVGADGDVVVCKTGETGVQWLPTRPGLPRLSISEQQIWTVCCSDSHALPIKWHLGLCSCYSLTLWKRAVMKID